MSWQIAPGLIVIIGCFTATGVLLKGVDKLVFGRPRRTRITEFEHRLDVRDYYIEQAKLKATTTKL